MVRQKPDRCLTREGSAVAMNIDQQTAVLLERLATNDGQALGELFMLYRERLWRMLYVRLDRRLARRVAPDDVLQETFLDVAGRIGEYLADPKVPFYVWLRFLAVQRMQMAHRAHLGARGCGTWTAKCR